MKKMSFFSALLLCGAPLHGAAILSPSDFIIAIDNNRNLPGTANSGAEDQYKLFDNNNSTKLFTNGRAFAGVIVTPTIGSTVVKSFSFATANDSSNRDPVRYQLFGTNDAISSTLNSAGTAENWSLISSGLTGIAQASANATGRQTTAGLITTTNSNAFTSYKIVFTELRMADDAANAASLPNGMQLSDIRMFTDIAGTASIFPIAPTTGVIAIDQTDSFYPPTERPFEAIDGSKLGASKYLNFGREGAGLIVTPASGASVVQGLQLTTANDVEARDPSAYELYGTNSSIVSLDNSEGTGEVWSLISSGGITLPSARNTDGSLITFSNSASYTSYKIVFTDNKGPDGSANSIQFSEIQLFSNVPEPMTGGFLALAAVPVLRRRRHVKAGPCCK